MLKTLAYLSRTYFCLAVLVGCVVSGFAQSNSGTVHGTVVDPSGAVVSGAAVTIENPVSHYSRITTSDSQGKFEFDNLPYNNYHLSVAAMAAGFQVASQDINMRSAVPMELKISLALGKETQTVTVEAGADLVENTSTSHTDVDRGLFATIGRPVAIKTIRLGEVSNAEERARLRERLFREARSAGVLSHPGIVTIYDMEAQDDIAFIAMEYVNGPTLDQLISLHRMVFPSQGLRQMGRVGLPVGEAQRREVRKGPSGIMVLGSLERTRYLVLARNSRRIRQAVRLRRCGRTPIVRALSGLCYTS